MRTERDIDDPRRSHPRAEVVPPHDLPGRHVERDHQELVVGGVPGEQRGRPAGIDRRGLEGSLPTEGAPPERRTRFYIEGDRDGVRTAPATSDHCAPVGCQREPVFRVGCLPPLRTRDGVPRHVARRCVERDRRGPSCVGTLPVATLAHGGHDRRGRGDERTITFLHRVRPGVGPVVTPTPELAAVQRVDRGDRDVLRVRSGRHADVQPGVVGRERQVADLDVPAPPDPDDPALRAVRVEAHGECTGPAGLLPEGGEDVDASGVIERCPSGLVVRRPEPADVGRPTDPSRRGSECTDAQNRVVGSMDRSDDDRGTAVGRREHRRRAGREERGLGSDGPDRADGGIRCVRRPRDDDRDERAHGQDGQRMGRSVSRGHQGSRPSCSSRVGRSHRAWRSWGKNLDACLARR